MAKTENYQPAPRHLTTGVLTKQNEILRRDHIKLDTIEDPTNNEAARIEKQKVLDELTKKIDEVESTIASVNVDEFILRNDLLRQKENVKGTSKKVKDKSVVSLAKKQWSLTPATTTKYKKCSSLSCITTALDNVNGQAERILCSKGMIN